MQLFINGRAAALSDYAEDDLARSVVISLFTWRRADADDALPGKTRYGWWADTYAGGDKIGSKLWLLSRAKLTDATLQQAKEYAEEALAWLTDDGVASEVAVDVSRGSAERLDLSVAITQPGREQLNLRFQDVWER